MNPDSLAYLEHLRVAQTKINEGDVRWYVQSANGFPIRGPFDSRELARDELDVIRALAFEEDAEDDWEVVARDQG